VSVFFFCRFLPNVVLLVCSCFGYVWDWCGAFAGWFFFFLVVFFFFFSGCGGFVFSSFSLSLGVFFGVFVWCCWVGGFAPLSLSFFFIFVSFCYFMGRFLNPLWFSGGVLFLFIIFSGRLVFAMVWVFSSSLFFSLSCCFIWAWPFGWVLVFYFVCFSGVRGFVSLVFFCFVYSLWGGVFFFGLFFFWVLGVWFSFFFFFTFFFFLLGGAGLVVLFLGLLVCLG